MSETLGSEVDGILDQDSARLGISSRSELIKRGVTEVSEHAGVAVAVP